MWHSPSATISHEASQDVVGAARSKHCNQPPLNILHMNSTIWNQPIVCLIVLVVLSFIVVGLLLCKKVLDKETIMLLECLCSREQVFPSSSSAGDSYANSSQSAAGHKQMALCLVFLHFFSMFVWLQVIVPWTSSSPQASNTQKAINIHLSSLFRHIKQRCINNVSCIVLRIIESSTIVVISFRQHKFHRICSMSKRSKRVTCHSSFVLLY